MSDTLVLPNSTAMNEVRELTADELELIAGGDHWSPHEKSLIVGGGLAVGGLFGGLFALGVIDGHNDKQ